MLMKSFDQFKSYVPQFLSAFTSSICVLVVGILVGWSSPSIPILMSPESPILCHPSQEKWFELADITGSLLTMPFSLLFLDSIGRKKWMQMSTITSLTGWILIAAEINDKFVIIGRLFHGSSEHIVFVVCCLYVAEIADPKIRGVLSGFISFMFILGLTIVYIIGPLLSIRTTALIGMGIIAIQLVSSFFLPESPYYLINIGDNEEARISLQCLRGKKNIEDELSEIGTSVKRQKDEARNLIEIFSVRSNRKAFAISTILMVISHLSGFSAFIMNIESILKQAGFSTTMQSSQFSVLFSSVMLISGTVMLFVVDQVGRKTLIISSTLLTSTALLILAIYFNFKLMSTNVDYLSWISVVCVIFFAFAYKIGLGIISVTIIPELFPVNARKLGIILGDLTYLLSSMTVIFIYEWFQEHNQLYFAFYSYGLSCLFSIIFTTLYVPETRGKSLEEIQMILKN